MKPNSHRSRARRLLLAALAAFSLCAATVATSALLQRALEPKPRATPSADAIVSRTDALILDRRDLSRWPR